MSAPKVLVIVRDPRLRRAVDATLRRHSLDVAHCDSLESVASRVSDSPGEVVLLDWSKAGALLAEERRAEIRQVCGHRPIVLLVPDSWTRLLTAEEFGVTRLLSKTGGMADLLDALMSAAGATSAG